MKPKSDREWTRLRQAYGAAGYEWTRIRIRRWAQISKKKIKYPQITQITQISSGALDTVKDRTSRRRTLEPVQDTGRSYQHKTAAKLGQNDLGEWL